MEVGTNDATCNIKIIFQIYETELLHSTLGMAYAPTQAKNPRPFLHQNGPIGPLALLAQTDQS